MAECLKRGNRHGFSTKAREFLDQPNDFSRKLCSMSVVWYVQKSCHSLQMGKISQKYQPSHLYLTQID
jgi:hypothetical protein